MLRIRTSSGKWERFCGQIMDFLTADKTSLTVDGNAVTGYRSPDSPALWIRDHSDMLRVGRYLEPDVKSVVECFAGTQAKNGRIFDYVLTSPLPDSTERENWEKWVRVPVEADVEYRFVKAAYLAWQAHGDPDWLQEILPALSKALDYSLTHALRWDPERRLVKRPYTIDTWDFDYTGGKADWLNFQITDHTYWGIFHGDNSGVYEAANLLAKMYEVVQKGEKSARWRRIAAGIKERANALLFNGRFYTHFFKLTPVTIAGCDETEQLSLSNPMAINRGLATHEIAVAILKEYQKRRATTDAFAEWFGIDPPFPDGSFGDKRLVGGAYINGGILPLAGGELARAALGNGFEAYGLETLEQYRKMIAQTNATYLWYFPDGTPCSLETSTSPEALPTDGWGSSAMLYAFLEGLCGIQDLAHSFEQVRCSPRWAVSVEEEVSVTVGYEPSRASFGYAFRHSKADSTISMRLEARRATVDLQVLLPHGCTAHSITWAGRKVPFSIDTVERSPYAKISGTVRKEAEVQISYQRISNVPNELHSQ